MTVQIYLQIDKRQLSDTKNNIIPVNLYGVDVGYVSKIVQEVGENQFLCDVLVNPQYKNLVLSAMQAEKDKLESPS